ncbi:MAG TPA: hypothetical protein VKA46_14445 [Gemmataceae bacterium]|nr:hypothetical protein [Gemmataceae bacterium]
MASQRLLPFLLLGLLVAALPLGCQHDEIAEYDVPKDEPRARLLGAIVPHDADVWFFKVAGPITDVAKQKDAFDRFVRSVHFPGNKDGKPVAWDVPDGWKEEAGPEPRYATFKLGPADSPLELTVTRLDNKGKAADVLENVNRWRKLELGLRAPLPEEDLPLVTRRDNDATFVDASGPGAPLRTRPADGMGGMGAAAARGGKPSFKYDTPAGWEKFDASRGIVPMELAFRIKDKETNQTADMTVSTGGGDVEANVVRWAGQVRLLKFSPADARKAMRPGTVDTLPAQFVDLEGPADDPAGRQRILGAIVKRDGTQWFFKLKGPHALVSKQEANFKKFLDSFKFEGGR